jgi:uncharacterized membrane protein
MSTAPYITCHARAGKSLSLKRGHAGIWRGRIAVRLTSAAPKAAVYVCCHNPPSSRCSTTTHSCEFASPSANMIAVSGGLCAACCWALTGLLAQRASRTIGEVAAFAWAALFGLFLVLIPGVLAAVDSHVSTKSGFELAVAGTLNVVGLVAQFSALIRGRVSMIIPITSAEGAVAALWGAADGVKIGTAGWGGLAAVMVGVAVTALAGRGDDAHVSGSCSRDVCLAIFAALSFGTSLYLQGHASAHAPVGLAIATPSLMGSLVVTAPLALARRLPSPGRTVPTLVAVAAAELLGFLSYAIGARHSLPVAAVLSSQYATISVIFGVVLFKEHPRPRQLVGYVLIIVGVAVVSAH